MIFRVIFVPRYGPPKIIFAYFWGMDIHSSNILIINGPNLNLVGSREPHIYGHQSFETYLQQLRKHFDGAFIDYFQSNHEGDLIDRLQQCDDSVTGVVLNPGGYAHTSIALADTITAVRVPVVEVHISNIMAREPYRQHSYTASKAIGSICGMGLDGYALAIHYLLGHHRAMADLG